MRKIVALALALGLTPSAYAASGVEVDKEDNGIYVSENLDTERMYYVVDTVAQLCFLKIASTVEPAVLVPCKNLKKRPEWAKIITWDDAPAEAAPKKPADAAATAAPAPAVEAPAAAPAVLP